MTIKQMNRERFYDALNEYRQALTVGHEVDGYRFTVASIAIHLASGADGVTTRMRRLVSAARTEAKKNRQAA